MQDDKKWKDMTRMKKKWGDKMRDEKKWGDKTGDKKKWGDEMRDKKKMKRQDQYEKIWGDKRQKTNAETRCKPKKKGLPDRDKKNGEMRR